MQTLAILLILAGPLACFLGCLIAALAEIIPACRKRTACNRWYSNDCP
jgi:uncharacterized protein involved in exopolysaccharide biosynthesis